MKVAANYGCERKLLGAVFPLPIVHLHFPCTTPLCNNKKSTLFSKLFRCFSSPDATVQFCKILGRFIENSENFLLTFLILQFKSRYIPCQGIVFDSGEFVILRHRQRIKGKVRKQWIIGFVFCMILAAMFFPDKMSDIMAESIVFVTKGNVTQF